MPTLTVTARGQVTFRKDVLKHLGLRRLSGISTPDLLKASPIRLIFVMNTNDKSDCGEQGRYVSAS